MNADGSGQTRLTYNATHDYFPRWSPDGRRIAFASLQDSGWEIYVMNADGSGQTRLTDNEGARRVPNPVKLVAGRTPHSVQFVPRRERGDIRDERGRLRRDTPH